MITRVRRGLCRNQRSRREQERISQEPVRIFNRRSRNTVLRIIFDHIELLRWWHENKCRKCRFWVWKYSSDGCYPRNAIELAANSDSDWATRRSFISCDAVVASRTFNWAFVCNTFLDSWSLETQLITKSEKALICWEMPPRGSKGVVEDVIVIDEEHDENMPRQGRRSERVKGRKSASMADLGTFSFNFC